MRLGYFRKFSKLPSPYDNIVTWSDTVEVHTFTGATSARVEAANTDIKSPIAPTADSATPRPTGLAPSWTAPRNRSVNTRHDRDIHREPRRAGKLDLAIPQPRSLGTDMWISKSRVSLICGEIQEVVAELTMACPTPRL